MGQKRGWQPGHQIAGIHRGQGRRAPANRTCHCPRTGRIFRASRPVLMNRLFRPTSPAWLALVVASAACVAWMDARRIARIERVSNLVPAAPTDDTSPTGYARGTRNLLLPADGVAGQPWIMDVQAMAATNTWRVQHAGYDNAPEGRAVHGAAPYRWWLRLVAAGLDGNRGRAVERAALLANPALHVLLCAGLGLLAAWRLGAATGGLLALGLAALLSQAQVFAPGQPDDHGLLLAANLTGLLLILAGFHADGGRAPRAWLAAAGVAGGFGMWLDAGSQLAVLAATWTGGLAVTWFRAGSGTLAPPWRSWALGGATVAILGWLIEGRPDGAWGLSLEANHPLLALAWFGAAETLVRLHAWRQGTARRSGFIALAAGALVVPASLGWLFQRGGASVSFGPGSPVLSGHESLAGWLRADGAGFGLVAALAPLLLVPVAGALLWRNFSSRAGLVFTLGTVAVLLPLGGWQLRWWGLLDVSLLGLLVAVASTASAGFMTIVWRTGLALLLLPGLIAAWPRATPDETLAPAEARALVERDLAQWLAARTVPGAIAFAPPALSGSLCYHGGLPVVASPYPGNRDGLALAVRIAAVGSTDEAQALVQQRGIQFLVLPSWDDTLDRLARMSTEAPERSLIALLRQWLPPRWLRPVAYQLPVIPGLENDSLAVFEVVEPQENAVALSRLAEYFVETGRLELAAAVGDSLARSFATDAGALIARARVALARGESRTLARIIPELLPAVADGKDEDLPWERRANLAIVLAQVKQADLARRQVEFCLAEADDERLRSLGPISLYRLLTLARAYRLEFAEPGLRDAALGLLPEEFRTQLR